MSDDSEGYTEPNAGDCARIQCAYQDAVRVLESQTQGGEALDVKAQQLLGMALLGLPAAGTLGTFLVERIPLDAALAARVAILLLILIGGIVNLWAVILLVDAYVGLRKRQHRAVAPHPQWLAEETEKPDRPVWEYHAGVVLAARNAYVHNEAQMRDVVELRQRAVQMLVGTVAAYFTAGLVMMGVILLG